MSKRLFGIFLLVSVSVSAWGSSFEQFKEKLSQTHPWETARKMITDYFATTDNVEEMRELQDLWQSVEPEACQAYFEAAKTRNHQSPLFQYLVLRLLKDEDLQQEEAYKLCTQYPDFYWGYRLFITSFMAWLLDAEAELNNPLEAQELALNAIDKGYQRFPQDDFFNIFQFHRYRILGDYTKAEFYLHKVQDQKLLIAHWQYIRFYLVQAKDAALFIQTAPNLLHLQVVSGDLTPRDSLYQFAEGYTAILEESKNWPPLELFLSQHPELLDNWAYLDSYLVMLADLARWAELLQQLAIGVNKGVVGKKQLETYGTLWLLDKRAEWPKLMQQAETQATRH